MATNNINEPRSTPPSYQSGGNQSEEQWPLVTVLVLNWNGLHFLEMCLPSLVELDYPDFSILVVDNASEDNSVDFIRRHYPQVNVIVNRENLGFSRAMNVGLKQAEGDIIVLLNNDIVARPGWLKALIYPFTIDETIGIAGCKLLYPDEKTIQHLGGEMLYPLAYSQHFHKHELDTGQVDHIIDVPFATGAAMAISRPVRETIGLLDESFHPIYYEDVDYCYRVREAGFRVVVNPTAVAIHHESATMSTVAKMQKYTFQKNRLRFVLHHYNQEQILNDFLPAECEQLRQELPDLMIPLMQQIYLETAVIVPEIMKRRQAEHSIKPLQNAMLHLRNVAQQRLEMDLDNRQELEEPEFVSNTMLIGPLLSRFRELWNSVSTKWFVRGIIQQQMRFNRLVSQQLRANSQVIDPLASELVKLSHQQEETTHQIQLELDQLQKRLTELETKINKEKPEGNGG